MSRRNLEILACEPTGLGLLCLRRRTLLSQPDVVVTEMTLDHELLMSSYITESERALARIALEMHPGRDLRVLVGGLGLGYTAQEALASERVAQVEVVELLPQVLDWLEQDLLPCAAELKADPRVTVSEGDVYRRLLHEPPRQHDLVLIDVDHSPDEQLSAGDTSFYTRAGLQLARQHLAPGGILAVWSYAEHSPFATALREVFGEVRIEPVTVWNDLVDEEQTDWLFFARG